MDIVNMNIVVENALFKQNKIEVTSCKLYPDIKGEIKKQSEEIYSCMLSVSILNTECNPFPFDLNVEMVGYFTFKNGIEQSDVEKFIQTNGVQMIFPYLRSTVTTLTQGCLVNPIILPIVDSRLLFNKELK